LRFSIGIKSLSAVENQYAAYIGLKRIDTLIVPARGPAAYWWGGFARA